MKTLTRLLYPIPTFQAAPKQSLSLTITDPLHIYRNLVDTGILSPDPNQHRAAIVVQGVYERLLDYKPERYYDLKQRLDAVTASLRALEDAQMSQRRGVITQEPTWRDSTLIPKSWQSPQAQSKALVRSLSNDQDLLNLQSPRGLLLSGTVGSGKSLLADILASSLPHAHKQRVHFDAFMLSVYARLEDHRRRTDLRDTYSLLHVARELVASSTVLFLDEFQMPDRASGKILKSLLSNFFMLGGVLVATSNRLPETLVAAKWRREEFGVFEEVLRSRCEIWDMSSGIDWRRRGELGRMVTVPHSKGRNDMVVAVPKFYYVKHGDLDEAWQAAVGAAATTNVAAWEARSLVVYGRELLLRRTYKNVIFVTFDEICAEVLGPADYISIASKFSTIIVDNIPVLTSKSHRHEAKRFITLLDAIYECRCKLLLRAEAPIEELFFPDAAENDSLDDRDSLHSEAFAEAHQDLTVPFRPNVSLYDHILDSPADPVASKRAIYNTADQDASSTGNVDFTATRKYTGEDEKFSFKRAVSRVWEVCGEKWWTGTNLSDHGSTSNGVSHLPMPKALRRWEGGSDRDELTGNNCHDVSPSLIVSTQLRPEAPRFMPVHVWGVIDNWGKRAGRWGRGVNAYKTDTTRDTGSGPKRGE
ncbi:hypothetical protein DRE_06085 [Drechslerella stenobrocha 248]|uniref:AAA+ ATPase domain-containing protein n=1 Tax=Drechslerella stenobrocha 248 TaxID=1043628 RepID=W7HYF7_9PEZI|nr:hypothetical protein DRE_06085 [Drechslerella stenobrocha 248]